MDTMFRKKQIPLISVWARVILPKVSFLVEKLMVIESVFANKTEHNLHFLQSVVSFRSDLRFVEPNGNAPKYWAAPGRQWRGGPPRAWPGLAWPGLAWPGQVASLLLAGRAGQWPVGWPGSPVN